MNDLTKEIQAETEKISNTLEALKEAIDRKVITSINIIQIKLFIKSYF